MNNIPRCITVLLMLALAGAAALTDDFDVDWYTIDGGGEMWTTGGDFELSGTIGQPDAGVMTGGDFELAGGFWPGGAAEPFCHGDIYPPGGDGVVNLDDLAQLLGHFGMTSGATYEDGDIYPPPDGNGAVNLDDLAELLGHYNVVCW